MSKKKIKTRQDITIINNIATWNMNMQGQINGTYIGTFQFKCFLSPTEKINADKERRELLGSNPFAADEEISFLAYALTQLKYRIISAPPFWQTNNTSAFSGDLPDQDVLVAVLDAALGSEIKFKEIKDKEKLQAIKRAKYSIKNAMENQDSEEADEESEDDDV